MTFQITTLASVTTPINTRTILTNEGYACSLLTLAPGEKTLRREANRFEEQILFVIEGEATISFGELNTIVGKDEAHLARKGEDYVIVAHPGGGTKILRIDVPPRQIVTPQIITFER